MPFTKNPLQKSVPVSGTERPSPELKNSWQSGLRAEALVIQYFTQKDYHLLAQRYQCRSCEVDLIFAKKSDNGKNSCVLVEVKTVSNEQYIDVVISKNQKRRLKRAFLEFAEAWLEVRLHLAIVTHNGEVRLIEDIFG